ncbi:LLM class flavin-dependent oxidoreductase [Methylocapsa palsarum]|uniref:Flavin-dependent oxidoreductase, luciferase family (Includes alkanesulfonate monooxygenase SsuD and methylene tetrahydromethanopterin reductase) n=1 Tax=Methylocapsa palsarum TaxID=1612308 RepID=A0A1I3Y126_9HYPH|nr:LLM class flavin-dependent oxidoreductase [Methylocapsa palsarum]SFK24991.1 Flavin-dependent oxidoreductase, luciferase family (includes alkanesulfonate monooxygenase SsuD and methylene tetrahydromethanopterin reductase) [Methylocapsa palsarum]
MRTGLFCTYEDPQGDRRSAFADQLKLVQLAEKLGFDEAWVAEHHFNANALTPSSLVVLAHLAARTSRIRLGSAAVLLPLRNPIQVAEEVATLDILSEGRFDFGVAKGGPFPLQNKHFGVSSGENRAKTIEALGLIQKLLNEDGVHFEGEFFKADDVSLTPKPLQTPVPTFIATSTPDMVRIAAERGYGVMAGPPFPLESIRDNVRFYREVSPSLDPNLVLIRFCHFAPTRAQAIDEAAVFLQPFIERMTVTTARMQPEWTPWFKLERLIEDSLIGAPADIADKVSRMKSMLQPRSLVLKLLSPDIFKRRTDLERFADLVAGHC